MRLICIILACAVAMALASCAGGRGGSIPYDVAEFGAPDAPEAMVMAEEYRISPLDTLKIAVFHVDELSQEYRVDLAGNIAFPLVGEVKAVGLTTNELQQSLGSKLGERYLQDPRITVSVTESQLNSVTVEGAVRQSGVFPVAGTTTLIQAVALAKGVDDTANPRRIAVFRMIDGKRQAAAFDLVSIGRGEAPNPKLYAGDIVVVDGSALRATQREILSTVPLLGIFRPFFY